MYVRWSRLSFALTRRGGAKCRACRGGATAGDLSPSRSEYARNNNHSFEIGLPPKRAVKKVALNRLPKKSAVTFSSSFLYRRQIT